MKDEEFVDRLYAHLEKDDGEAPNEEELRAPAELLRQIRELPLETPDAGLDHKILVAARTAAETETDESKSPRFSWFWRFLPIAGFAVVFLVVTRVNDRLPTVSSPEATDSEEARSVVALEEEVETSLAPEQSGDVEGANEAEAPAKLEKIISESLPAPRVRRSAARSSPKERLAAPSASEAPVIAEAARNAEPISSEVGGAGARSEKAAEKTSNAIRAEAPSAPSAAMAEESSRGPAPSAAPQSAERLKRLDDGIPEPARRLQESDARRRTQVSSMVVSAQKLWADGKKRESRARFELALQQALAISLGSMVAVPYAAREYEDRQWAACLRVLARLPGAELAANSAAQSLQKKCQNR